MCLLCDKFYRYSDYREFAFVKGITQNVAIVKNVDGDYGLFAEQEGSNVGNLVMLINYCPKCGRRLENRTIDVERLTYRSNMGDYGSNIDWKNEWMEIYALRNKVGMYEDNNWKTIEKDGNPKKSGYYLVTRILYDDSKVVSRRFYNAKTNRWDEESARETKLIAWKYLPKPYEEGKDESFETYEE